MHLKSMILYASVCGIKIEKKINKSMDNLIKLKDSFQLSAS